MDTPNESQKDMPWWLLGNEQCGWCLQSYALEVEYRCDYCDEPVCPDCVVEISVKKLVLCGPCADAHAAESGTKR